MINNSISHHAGLIPGATTPDSVKSRSDISIDEKENAINLHGAHGVHDTSRLGVKHELLANTEVKGTSGSGLVDLETDTGKITDGMTGSIATGPGDPIALIDEGHSSISGDVSGDSLAVLSELNSDAFTDGGVRLLGFKTDLLDDDASGERGGNSGNLASFSIGST